MSTDDSRLWQLLGNIEAKLDAQLILVQQALSENKDLEARVSALERSKSYMKGALLIIGGAVTLLVKETWRLITDAVHLPH